jgi:mxaA protein
MGGSRITPSIILVTGLWLAPRFLAGETLPSGLQNFQINDPRPYGYVLGDTLRRDIVLTLERGWRVQPGSLPAPGRVNFWLELREARLDRGVFGGGQHLRLTYQTFYAPREVKKVSLPGFNLTITDGGKVTEVPVPSLPFTLSPLIEARLAQEAGWGSLMRPDGGAPLLDVRPARWATMILGALCLPIIFLLARHYGIIPGRPGPFAQAVRELRRLGRRDLNRERYGHALQAVHKAFNQTNAAPLFAEQLDGFLGRFKPLAPFRDDLVTFFETSRQFFFGEPGAELFTAYPLSALEQLCRRCRTQEKLWR